MRTLASLILRAGLAALLLVGGMNVPLLADTVKLNDGTILTGKMLSQDPSGITFESAGKERYISKRDIKAFREDDAGLDYSRKRDEETALAAAEKEKLRQDATDKLAPSYNGIWFGVGFGRGRLQTFQENLLQSDRILSNAIAGAGTASVYSKADNQKAKGYSGYILFRRETFYIEAAAYSFLSEGHFDQVGLPPITSIVQSSSSTTNQLGDFHMKPARKQNATAVFAFQPVPISPRWQLFFLGGITGDRTSVRLDADILTNVSQRFTPTFVLVANVYTQLRGFKSKLYGEGGIGGLDLRFRPGGGFELRALARFSSIEGHYKSRGNLTTVTSIALVSSVSTTGSVNHFREDAAIYERLQDYSLTFYAPVGSRLRIFTTAGRELTSTRLMHRAAMDYSQTTSVSNFFQNNLGQYLTKLYTRPEHTGRISRIIVGIEARI